MIPSKFATIGSGVLADKIGWFDFGPGFTLVPGALPVHVINSLPNGYTVEFDISLVNNSGPATNFVSTTPPTYARASFGNTGYTGIAGEVVLYSNSPSLASNESIQLTNIVVKNSKNVATTTYKWVVANAETTEGAEGISITTNGSVWTLLENLPPVGGFIANTPSISGLGTATVVQTGIVVLPSYPSGPVVVSATPTAITVTNILGAGGREGQAFGVIITEREQAISDMIESVALEQTALSHILNAEGEKIQAAVANGTIDQMLQVNESVQSMVNAVARLEMVLEGKLDLFSCQICPDITPNGTPNP